MGGGRDGGERRDVRGRERERKGEWGCGETERDAREGEGAGARRPVGGGGVVRERERG